jgi:hypothetical protein
MRMTTKRALERWEMKMENCEITPQAIWPIVKFPMKRGGPKTPTVIHGHSGPIFYPIDKANEIANYLENQLTPHELCDSDNERQVVALVQALLDTVKETPL